MFYTLLIWLQALISSHPQDERFNRRCWVTFNNNVNIKDICWNLNNIRLKASVRFISLWLTNRTQEVELNPVVNRDLQRRARPMSSLSNHSVIMYQGWNFLFGASCFSTLLDLKYLVKIIDKFDGKFGLYEGATNLLVTEANKYMEENPAPTGESDQ